LWHPEIKDERAEASMPDGFSRAEIEECLPQGECEDCMTEAWERAGKYGTTSEHEYKNVFYIAHLWDGI
jgi:hypothetical protein